MAEARKELGGTIDALSTEATDNDLGVLNPWKLADLLLASQPIARIWQEGFEAHRRTEQRSALGDFKFESNPYGPTSPGDGRQDG